MERLKEILINKQPYVVLLVGTPLVGKSTFISEHLNDIQHTIISRDDIIMEIAGTSNYNEAYYKILNEKADKKVDKILKQRLLELSKNKENVIIDMTNLTTKSRHKHIAKFTKHFKCAIVFDFLTDEEYNKRNDSRKLKENKTISTGVMERMVKSYQKIMDIDGFDLVINRKEIL